ncbi:MAG: response regulator [Deltaproteobacteria bacterium]|nr:response regulator [Deltaproteobacteria bacterium]
MSKTILVVEDDENVQRFLTDLLEDEGFDVVCEKDGEWALRALARRDFDFVILDVLLPGISGFQVAERIRQGERRPQVPILMISGIYRGGRHRKDSIERYRVVDYLDKPFAGSKVVDALRATFGKQYPDRASREKQRAAADVVPAESLADRFSHAEQNEVEASAREHFQGGKVARGTLQQTPFAVTLAQLYRWRATGALLLRRGKLKKIVYFKEGYPTYVKSNVLAECLGKVMLRERLITATECEESIRTMKSSQRQQGTVLIEMGCISPHNLVYALELQLQTKLFDIFSWTDGDFQFNPRSVPPSEIIELDMTPATIIFEGIKRTCDEDRLLSMLREHMDSYLVVHPDPLQRFQEMDLTPDERRFVALIDGKKTLAQILDKDLLPRTRALALASALVAAQMVQPQPRSAAKREKLEPTMPPVPPPLSQRLKPVSPEGGRLGPPPLSMPPPLSPRLAAASEPQREASLREQLARKAKEMRRMNYFEVLGVSKTATSDEVRKAYYALARDYHPDKHFGNASADVRALADQIYSMINSAWEVLSNAKDRTAYEADLASGLKQGPTDEVSRILAAESKFQEGESLLKKREYGRAAEAFRDALGRYDEEGEFHAYLGWALFQSDPNNQAVQRQAEDHIARGIDLNPKVDKAYLFLGNIYKATGRPLEAEEQFEKAIKCNPDCTDALRELKLIEQTRAREKKGLFTDPPA